MQNSFFHNIRSGFRAVPSYMTGIAITLSFLTLGLGYFTTQSSFLLLTALSISFFTIYLFINIWTVEEKDIWFYVGLGILLRVLLLPSFPLLSNDVYRFIWDGHLLRAGINPFEHLPTYYANQGFVINGLNQELYTSLNSPNYYTIYPPLAQFTFWVATLLSPKSWLGAAIVMRVFILLTEISSIFLISRLLKHFEYPLKNVLFYALNPLIIIELTGNLHFEAVMIFFLLLAFYLLVKCKNNLSAVALAFSVLAKLLPLLFLPFIAMRLKWKKLFGYLLIFSAMVLVFFMPLIGNLFFNNFFESIDLYFRKFEFNASIYYLVRWFGFQVKGYNIIQSAGPILAACTFLGIAITALIDKNKNWKNLPFKMLFAICLYLLFTTTVHPWYVALPIVLCIFTPYRFPLLWSGLIWLTYANYTGDVYKEKLGLVALEYIALIFYAFWEIFLSKGHRGSIYH